MRLIAWLTIVTAARRLSDLKEERHCCGFAFHTILSLFIIFFFHACVRGGCYLFCLELILLVTLESRHKLVSPFLNRSIDRRVTLVRFSKSRVSSRGMRWTRLQRLILLPCNEQVRAANNRLLLIQETDFRDPGFHGSYGQDVEREGRRRSFHSTIRIFAELRMLRKKLA